MGSRTFNVRESVRQGRSLPRRTISRDEISRRVELIAVLPAGEPAPFALPPREQSPKADTAAMSR